MEVLAALTLSSLVMLMVTGVFLAQNRSYQVHLRVNGAQDDARSVGQVLSSELRSVMEDGVTLAETDEITVRTPIVVAAVCDRGVNHITVHTEGGRAAIEAQESEVAGFAVRDSVGGWAYYNTAWADIERELSGNPARDCHDNLADTVGASGEFHSLENLDTYHPTTPEIGDVILLFRETTFKLQTSILDPTTIGLFRRAYGGSLVEFVTGMDSTAQFQYRLDGSYQNSVSSSSLGDIDVVRIVAEVKRPAPAGIQGVIRLGRPLNVALRNVR